MDGEFESFRTKTSTVFINIVSREEHVPESDNNIRTVKDRTRITLASLTFQRIPNHMLTELVFCQFFWLNAFPNKYGVSSTLSSWTIMTGKEIDYIKHCKILPGQYVQAHEEHPNDTNEWKPEAIALRPTGNEEEGHYFMSIPTGRIINRNGWTELPIPDSVINVVHRLSRRNSDGFTYTCDDDVIIPDDVTNDLNDDDESSDYENDSDYVHDDDEYCNDENESDYIDTDPMSITYNIDNPPNTYDAFYGEPIAGVEDHEEETHHEENTDCNYQGHRPNTQQQ